MKKLLTGAIMLIPFLATAQITYVDLTNKISDKYIYFFTQDLCPHCNHAATYITINYPTLKVKYLQINDSENQERFIACADKFHLDKRKLGTPLICMGQNYILGWTETEQKKFDEYVKPFIDKNSVEK